LRTFSYDGRPVETERPRLAPGSCQRHSQHPGVGFNVEAVGVEQHAIADPGDGVVGIRIQQDRHADRAGRGLVDLLDPN
jgi:hypothetical protein